MAMLKLQAGAAKAVTPSDTADILRDQENDCSGPTLYVGTGGSLVVITIAGDEVTFANVPDGTFIPVMVKRVKAATTATDILALW